MHTSWQHVFDQALPYGAFLERYGSEVHRARWKSMNDRIRLSQKDLALLGSFRRRMPVLCLAGAWCGDCVNQCPIFDHFQAAATALEIRYLDRDALPEVRDALSMNGGHRVPMVLFLSEDYQEVARFGERTLSGYRRLAQQQLGPACPTGLVPPDDQALTTTISDWLDQFERAQLVLRLSPRLRELHGD